MFGKYVHYVWYVLMFPLMLFYATKKKKRKRIKNIEKKAEKKIIEKWKSDNVFYVANEGGEGPSLI